MEWISPAGVVALLALFRRARIQGMAELTIIRPELPNVADYLRDIGFLGVLLEEGAEVAPEPAPPDASRIRACLPVTLVTTEFEMERAANTLHETLLGIGAPPGAIHATYLLMTELTNNAWQHGSPCFVVAQTHSGATSGTPGIHLAIADFGPGIRKQPEQISPSDEAEAMLLAFQEGVTGTGDRMRGLGLNYALEAVAGYPGSTLCVVSGAVMVRREQQEFVTFTGPDCGGVFIAAYLPFDPKSV